MPNKYFSFSYIGFPQTDIAGNIIGETYRPIVQVRISYGHRLSREYDALVDSGSDRNLFPAELGELLGISFKKQKSKIINGIGGIKIKAYSVNIVIYLGSYKYNTSTDFSYEQRDLLLGREGFFNLFTKLIFRENDKFLDIYL
ncbi:MAG: hypothetical protein PHV63_01435 [Candidatus Daviesbacteria bacterium]|nr:hypothetical protein [Candidatus Daviesbacteria bacterium]